MYHWPFNVCKAKPLRPHHPFQVLSYNVQESMIHEFFMPNKEMRHASSAKPETNYKLYDFTYKKPQRIVRHVLTDLRWTNELVYAIIPVTGAYMINQVTRGVQLMLTVFCWLHSAVSTWLYLPTKNGTESSTGLGWNCQSLHEPYHFSWVPLMVFRWLHAAAMGRSLYVHQLWLGYCEPVRLQTTYII